MRFPLLRTFKAKSLFIVASLVAFQTFASNEKVGGVELMDCEKDFCVQLKTDKLFKSNLSPNYAFGPSQIKVFENQKEVKINLDGFEGSFDPSIGRFYLSSKTSTLEYVIDTKDRQIYTFTRS